MFSCSPSLVLLTLIGPVNKSPDETHFVRVRGKAEIMS